MEKTTKQGVRNLNHLPSPARERSRTREPYGPLHQCRHPRMRVVEAVFYCYFHHRPTMVGEYDCEDCGLFVEFYDV